MSTSAGVPLFANQESLAAIRPQILERMERVLGSGSYILGEEVDAFEAELASYVGRRFCVGLNSGTDALTIGLRAMGVPAGSEVVVPAVSFFATAEAVVNAGAVPVFADVEPGTWCLSDATVEPVLTDRTAAIVPVHLFGNPAPMDGLMKLGAERGLPLLEDAAQAIGATLGGRAAGALGDAAAFSFYPSKNLGAIGDAGAFLTDDEEVAELARRLREHGSADRTVHSEVGFNSRLDELQAAALRVALPHLDGWTEDRRRAAAAYEAAGIGELVGLPQTTPGAAHCHHLYVVATSRRDELARALAAADVGHRVYYTPALPQQPALSPYGRGPLPGAERYENECLALPMGPDLGRTEIERIADTMRRAVD